MAEIPHVQIPTVNYAKQNGWFARRLQWIGRVGAVDVLFAKKGITLWFEFKDFGKPPNTMQAREHKRMRKAGLQVFVVDNVALGMRLLDEHDPDAI